jgi:hypothetical protein
MRRLDSFKSYDTPGQKKVNLQFYDYDFKTRRKMGHKGVSQCKPKKAQSFSNDNLNGSSKTRLVKNSLVQSLVKDNGATLNRGGINPSAGSNKKHQKGK